jgi:hypothetical protein
MTAWEKAVCRDNMVHILSYIADTPAFEDTDGESPQACHVFRPVTFWVSE